MPSATSWRGSGSGASTCCGTGVDVGDGDGNTVAWGDGLGLAVLAGGPAEVQEAQRRAIKKMTLPALRGGQGGAVRRPMFGPSLALPMNMGRGSRS